MRKFGELKGYQGDIKGKALVDYTKWIMGLEEKMIDLSGKFHSHEAGEISRYFSEAVKQRFNQAEKTLEPFWTAYNELQHQLIEELELTVREKKLWEPIWEYMDIKGDESDYTWERYIENFKQYHNALNELTTEDKVFIDFWIKGY